MTKPPVFADLMSADWVFTRYGRLFHIARPKDLRGDHQWHTFCGRFASENADAPWCVWGGKACGICVKAAREAVKSVDKPQSA